LPGCEIELTQAPKFQTARDCPRDNNASASRRRTQLPRTSFGIEPPTGCAQFKVFIQRPQRTEKIKSL
jgi:hypothetical protein